MSEGQSQRSVASSARHRQEAEIAAAEERERAAAETAAAAERAARLAAAELAATRAEVEAAAARAARLCAAVAPAALPMAASTWSPSRRGKQRESGRRSGQPRTPMGAVAAAQTGADAPTALQAEARAAAALPAAAAAQTGADAPAGGSTEIAVFTGDAALPPRTGTMVTAGSRPLSGTLVPAVGGLPSPRPTTSSGPR